jgi:hypothetical protein
MKYELIGILILGIILSGSAAGADPSTSIFFAVIIAVSLLCVPLLSKNNRTQDSYTSGSNAEQRRLALREAKIFLAPYSNIWKNLRLSNKYVSIILGGDGATIKCIEKVKPYRKFRVLETPIHTPEELWNLFCIYFTHNKSYDGVLEDCFRYHVSTMELSEGQSRTETIKPEKTNITNSNNNQPIHIDNIVTEKIDINNCSEIELTELPGVSIVIAKKAIKRREELGGFKSVDEFLSFIELKPHMESRLRNRIKVEKMKGSLHTKKYSERSVDF